MRDESKNETDKLSRKQEAAIVALLAKGTVRDAAKDANVSEATLWRWMQQEAFREAYRAARRESMATAITALQAVAHEAVDALQRNLTCGEPKTEVAAARVVLAASFKSYEVQDIEARLEEVEGAVERQESERKAS